MYFFSCGCWLEEKTGEGVASQGRYAFKVMNAKNSNNVLLLS